MSELEIAEATAAKMPLRRLDANSLFELAALLDQLTKPEEPKEMSSGIPEHSGTNVKYESHRHRREYSNLPGVPAASVLPSVRWNAPAGQSLQYEKLQSRRANLVT